MNAIILFIKSLFLFAFLSSYLNLSCSNSKPKKPTPFTSAAKDKDVTDDDDDNDNDDDGDEAADDNTASDDLPTGDLPDFETKESCNAEGKVYLPTPEGGSLPPECGEPLVEWACCKAEILARFPLFKTQLEEEFANKASESKELYNCGKVGIKEYWLHFMLENDTGEVVYSGIKIPGTMTEPSVPVVCE